MRFMLLSFLIPHIVKDSNQTIIGGAAVQWKSWIKGFLDNNQEFGILTFKGAKDIINQNVKFDILESYDPDYGINRLRVVYYQIPKMISAIRRYKPDFIIQGGATSHTGILMLISKLLKIPFVHRIANDPDVDERIYKMVHKREIFWYKLGVKYADFIITQNSYQYQKLQEKFPEKKIYKISNPFEIVTKSDDILPRKSRKYVAWVGNFRYMKNLPCLVKIVKTNPNINFKIAGRQHRDADSETIDAINKMRKLENVEFVGYLTRTEIIKFFLESIALLNTSYFEGFSNTFLEAWSCGVPVISTKFVNPDQIINTFNIGKIAENHKLLSDCLSEVIKLSNEEYNILTKRCYNYVVEYHDPSKLAEQLINFLEQNK